MKDQGSLWRNVQPMLRQQQMKLGKYLLYDSKKQLHGLRGNLDVPWETWIVEREREGDILRMSMIAYCLPSSFLYLRLCVVLFQGGGHLDVCKYLLATGVQRSRMFGWKHKNYGNLSKEERAKGHKLVGNVVFIIFILCNCFMIPHCELDDLDTCTSFGMKEIVIFIYVL